MSKIFVSYKYKDPNVQYLPGATIGWDTDFKCTPRHYVDKLIRTLQISNHIYKGEASDESLDSFKNSTIESRLKAKIFDSTITVVLISPSMRDSYKSETDQWIPNEIAYSLRSKTRGSLNSNPNGLIFIVLPDYYGKYDYVENLKMFNIITKNIIASLKSGYEHYNLPEYYAVFLNWDEFLKYPNYYIKQAVIARNNIEKYNNMCKTI